MSAHPRSVRRWHLTALRSSPTAQDLFGPAGTPRVVVVGAGLGGIGAGVKLKQAGIDTFTIYESSPGVGGTWWDNTYPGAEVDVHSNLYCYSFKSLRLDPHPRPTARAADVPGGDGRRVRPPPAPPAGRDRPVGHVGRRPPRLDGHPGHRLCRRVPRGRQRRRLPQRPPVSRLAGAGGVRGAEVPHVTVGASARPVRQGRGRGGDGVDGHPGRAGHPAHRWASSMSSSGSPGGSCPKGSGT